ncbi:MAG: hypothetical protein DMF71_06155, partial [Acidobacteria bacterium]
MVKKLRLIGKRLRVRGTLFHAHTGHHFTRVLMDAQSLTVERT